MRYLSVCSGIEAATVAWHGLGWTPVAFSEIEPFPSAVLQHHYPHVPNVGDMTKFKEWNLGSIDLLVGGTPCQSFSVAGLRKGLDDPRGNLMLTFVEIAQRYRPRWVVWENVPGVLSLDGGRAFGTLLGALGELGYGWAYRVLDAQWFGVAQRRRRVFVVGYLGDWQRAAQVLFERESVRRDSPPSREARQGAAASVGGGPDSGRIAGTVSSKWSKGSGGIEREDGSRGSTNIGKQAGKGFLGSEERAFTLAAAQDRFVAQPVAFHNRQDPDVSGDITHPLGAKDNGMAVAQLVPDVAPTLDQRAGRSGENSFATSGGLVPVAQPVAYDIDGEQNCSEELIGTLRSHQSGGYEGARVAQPVAPALTASNDPSRSPQSSEVTQQVSAVHATTMQVRRLTPVECERLQGFPDGYTNIAWRKKPEAPDGPRYKALGNSMAVPCMRWIGERIQAATARQEVQP